MTENRIITTLVGAAAVVGLLCVGALASCGSSAGLLGVCVTAPDGADGGQLHDFDAEQRANAAIIIDVGRRLAVPPRGWVTAVATAIQESGLRNLPDLGARNDHDSIGPFQQRPSQGWGTPAQLADPHYGAGKFYAKLLTIPDWQSLPLAVAAQKVQVSAYPDAYKKWAADAAALVTTLASGADIPATGPDLCGAIGARGWTQPVHAFIVSGFRTAGRPTHDGVDLGAGRGTVIVAASGGTVQTVACNAHLVGGGFWGCDRDGDPIRVAGCGWYVDIVHPGGVISRYCHMQTRPFVTVGQTAAAGQPIGLVGSTGHSSGPHLHFEIHLGGDASSSGAIDPEQWMRLHGAPLGAP